MDDLIMLCNLYGIPTDVVKRVDSKTQRRRIEPKNCATLAVRAQGQRDREFVPETADGPCTDTTKVVATAFLGGSPKPACPGTNMIDP